MGCGGGVLLLCLSSVPAAVAPLQPSFAHTVSCASQPTSQAAALLQTRLHQLGHEYCIGFTEECLKQPATPRVPAGRPGGTRPPDFNHRRQEMRNLHLVQQFQLGVSPGIAYTVWDMPGCGRATGCLAQPANHSTPLSMIYLSMLFLMEPKNGSGISHRDC